MKYFIDYDNIIVPKELRENDEQLLNKVEIWFFSAIQIVLQSYGTATLSRRPVLFPFALL